MNQALIILLLFCSVALGCQNNAREVETNKIFRTIINQSRDSTAVYFQKVDSLGQEKIKTVTHPKQPDSVGIYYRSVDSLRLNIPINRKDFHLYELISHPRIDSLITDSTISQWNQEISHYALHKWSKKERNNLPVIDKKPDYLNGYFNSQGALKKMLYFSTPFFNEKNTKALVYTYKFSSDGKNGQLYILSKKNNTWYIIYSGVTFTSSF